MISLELRLALYAGLLAAIAIGVLIWHHLVILEGEAIVHRQIAATEQASKEAQKKQDEVTIHGLKDDLANLRAAAAIPAPVVRLCHSTPTIEVRAASTPAGASAAPTSPADVSPVPAGTGEGPDIGPGLQSFALACGLVSVRLKRLQEWAQGLK